uniref:Uncharacterized protein n=1 Tax=Rhizophora mucronata TaxID=61149 RepID=A0A2P2Q9P2_RHIMU
MLSPISSDVPLVTNKKFLWPGLAHSLLHSGLCTKKAVKWSKMVNAC